MKFFDTIRTGGGESNPLFINNKLTLRDEGLGSE